MFNCFSCISSHGLLQYSESPEEVHEAFKTIRACIGPLPLTTPYPEFLAQAQVLPIALCCYSSTG